MENHSNLFALPFEPLFDLQSSVHLSIEAVRLLLLPPVSRETAGNLFIQQASESSQESFHDDGAKGQRQT